MSALIQSTQCGSGHRKDCNFKKTCQFHHTGEIVGKEVDYYAKKFQRNSDKTTGASKKTEFPVSNFTKGSVKGDGHCMIHSVLSALEKNGLTPLTKEEILDLIKPSFQEDLEKYRPFIDGYSSDPIAEIDSYVTDANYNSNIGDFIIPVLADILKTRIIVMELNKDKTKYMTSEDLTYPSFSVATTDQVYVLKNGSHYDPLYDNSTSTPIVPPAIKSKLTNQENEKVKMDELDPTYILASLCTKAPDLEVRDCLRKFDVNLSLNRQKSVFNSFNKNILAKTANYLQIKTDQLLKPKIVHFLICKIQNLLPDTCQICNEEYVSRLDDMPFLACEICGQEVHKQCYRKLLNISQDLENVMFNTFNLPGIHYLCKSCEESTIPADDSEALSCTQQLRASQDSFCKTTNNSSESEPVTTESNQLEVDQPADIKQPSADSVLYRPVGDVSHQQLTQENDDLCSLTRANTPVVTKAKPKICVHYRKNQCRHGMKGKDCAFLHPDRCKKLLQHGTRQPNGCNLGRKCTSYHPKMCPSSVTKKVCYDDKCQFTHVKGTKRKASHLVTEKTSHHQMKPPTNTSKDLKEKPGSNSPESPTTTSFNNDISDSVNDKPIRSRVSKKSPLSNEDHTPSNASFLEMISLLKKELCEAMDTKIAMSLSQFQHYYPRMQLNQPFLPTHFPFPMPPYPTMPPQSPVHQSLSQQKINH